MSYNTEHVVWMQRAIDLAQCGIGMTSPNPPVGAVLVAHGRILGEGFHHRAGMPHAEREAIANALARGNGHWLEEATLYVTLEPCSTVGRTPACTDAILENHIKKVVYGAQDPNPKHAGAAKTLLLKHGVEVVTGVLERECQHLIRAFSKTILTERPWIIVKTAMSLDGHITRAPGKSSWLTSQASRNYVHTLRAQVDAILTTGETIRKDNPALTIRTPDRPIPAEKTQPWRIVVTQHKESLPKEASCFTDQWANRTILLENIVDYQQVMNNLYREYNISSILVESGGHFVGELLQRRLVDEWIGFYAPLITGGGIPGVVNSGFFNQEIRLQDVSWTSFGDDYCVRGLVCYEE